MEVTQLPTVWGPLSKLLILLWPASYVPMYVPARTDIYLLRQRKLVPIACIYFIALNRIKEYSYLTASKESFGHLVVLV